MGVRLGSFSKVFDDSYLLREVGDAKSVCIIGCPHCANQSIAYAKDMEIIGKVKMGGLAYDPYALTQEANRIKNLLATKGITAKTKIFGRTISPPCWMHEKERRMVATACENTHAAITLCCSSGCEGIKTALPKTVKVVPGMATIGTISAYLETKSGKDFLNKEKTKVSTFKELKAV
jgi:hypothetical protein